MLLSSEQKKRICILARKVWAGMTDADKAQYRNADGGQTETQAFDLWRRAQQSVAIGRLNLTRAENDEFCILMAHFAMLGNDSNLVANWLARFASDEKRRVFWLIKNACAGVVEFPNYPDAIARSQFNCRLWECTSKQLFNILYTTRSRVKSKKYRGQRHFREKGDF